jgi:surfeit locus 1 family protein
MKEIKNILFSIFMIAMIITLVALGSWQVKRYFWKADLIRDFDSKVSMGVVDVPSSFYKFAPNNTYRIIRLRGTFNYNKEIHLGPRYHPQYSDASDSKEYGYFIITPMILHDGQWVLVNRGWVPAKLKDRESRPSSLLKGEKIVTGMIREGQENKRPFVPKNDPKKNFWFWLDVNKISSVEGIDFGNYYIDEIDNGEGRVIKPVGNTKVNFLNNHLQYAFIWYGLAIVIIIGLVVIYRKKPELINNNEVKK